MEKGRCVHERLLGISEVLAKAVGVAEAVGGSVPSDAKEGGPGSGSSKLAHISDLLDAIDKQALYVHQRLVDIQGQL